MTSNRIPQSSLTAVDPIPVTEVSLFGTVYRLWFSFLFITSKADQHDHIWQDRKHCPNLLAKSCKVHTSEERNLASSILDSATNSQVSHVPPFPIRQSYKEMGINLAWRSDWRILEKPHSCDNSSVFFISVLFRRMRGLTFGNRFKSFTLYGQRNKHSEAE